MEILALPHSFFFFLNISRCDAQPSYSRGGGSQALNRCRRARFLTLLILSPRWHPNLPTLYEQKWRTQRRRGNLKSAAGGFDFLEVICDLGFVTSSKPTRIT